MTITELEREIHLHRKEVFSFCLQLTRNKDWAEELYQETWLSACKHVEKLEKGGNIKGYLLSVAIHLWKNQKRKAAWRKRIAPQEELLEEAVDDRGTDGIARLGSNSDSNVNQEGEGLARYLALERRNAVRKAVGRLDERYRIPVLFFYMEELSIAEIAAALGIPRGTVKSRLDYARKHLKKELEDFVDE